MKPELTNFRSASSKILWCAVLLIIMGFTTEGQRVPEVLSPVALVLGGVLTFVGAVRMSLVMRPRNLVFFGIFLIVASFTVPVLAAHCFPAIKTFHWTIVSLAPLYACELAGMIFLSTGLLRLLSGK